VIGMQPWKPPDAEQRCELSDAEVTVDRAEPGDQPGQRRRGQRLKLRQFGAPDGGVARPLSMCPCTVHDAAEPDQRRTDGFAGTAFKTGIEMGVEPFVAGDLPRDPALYQRNATAWRVRLVAPQAVGRAMLEAEPALDALVGEIEQTLQVLFRAVSRIAAC